MALTPAREVGAVRHVLLHIFDMRLQRYTFVVQHLVHCEVTLLQCYSAIIAMQLLRCNYCGASKEPVYTIICSRYQSMSTLCQSMHVHTLPPALCLLSG